MLTSNNQTENLLVLLNSRYSEGEEWQRADISTDHPLANTLMEMAEKGWILCCSDDSAVNPNGEKLGTYLIQLTDDGEIVARQIGLTPELSAAPCYVHDDTNENNVSEDNDNVAVATACEEMPAIIKETIQKMLQESVAPSEKKSLLHRCLTPLLSAMRRIFQSTDGDQFVDSHDPLLCLIVH